VSRDPRCEWLIEKSVRYHALSGKVIEKRLAQMCQKHGLSDMLCLGDYEFLAAVANAKTDNVNMAQIARLLAVNPSSATRRTRRLMDCGLVSKTSDSADERRYQIALTEKGHAFWAEMEERLQAMMQEICDPVTQEEMQTVIAFTDQCIDSLQKILDEWA
jgi:DNA-binding MarR family transcriptional regulator